MFDGITSQPAYTRSTPANNPQQAGNQANNTQNQNTAAAQNTAAQQPQPHQPQFNQPVHAAHAAQQPQFTAMGVQGLTAPSALEAAQMGTSNAVTAMGGHDGAGICRNHGSDLQRCRARVLRGYVTGGWDARCQ